MELKPPLTRNRCTGCRACEVVCSTAKEGMVDPEKSRIRIQLREEEGLVHTTPMVCRQCDPPDCAEACPVEAIEKDKNTGAMIVDKAECVGCGECVDACPHGAIVLDGETELAVICDLCGGDPLCVKTCPDKVLHYDLSDKLMSVRM